MICESVRADYEFVGNVNVTVSKTEGNITVYNLRGRIGNSSMRFIIWGDGLQNRRHGRFFFSYRWRAGLRTNASEMLERFVQTVNWNIIKCVAVACVCLLAANHSAPRNMSNHSSEIDALQFMGVFITEVGGATMALTSGFAACTDGSDSEESTCTRPSSLTSLRLTLI